MKYGCEPITNSRICDGIDGRNVSINENNLNALECIWINNNDNDDSDDDNGNNYKNNNINDDGDDDSDGNNILSTETLENKNEGRCISKVLFFFFFF